MQPDFTKVESLPALEVELPAEKVVISEMVERAHKYLRSFTWCNGVLETYAGIVVPRVLAVLLHRILPARDEVDEWVWSVTGDLPSAYITLDDAPNPATALDGYIGAMKEWTEAVRLGQPVDDLIPVNTPPELRFAEMLDTRLNFLSNLLDTEYADDL